MANTPLVTICMPTYNHGKYLESAIYSVVTQNYTNIQLIISDDCSTDNSVEIIQDLKHKFPHIIEAQFHAKNLGAEENIHSIYPLIKGDFVCWFSGDDLFAPNKVDVQVSFMRNNIDCIFSFHAVNVISQYDVVLYEYNDPLIGVPLHTQNIASNLLRHRCFFCANSMMINRNLAKSIMHKQGVGICNDWLLAIELSIAGPVLYIPEILGSYRRHGQNISKQINIAHEEAVYDFVLKQYLECQRDIYFGLTQLYSMYIFKYLLNRNLPKAMYCLRKLVSIFTRHPLNLRIMLFKIYSEPRRRLRLLRVTGSLNR